MQKEKNSCRKKWKEVKYDVKFFFKITMTDCEKKIEWGRTIAKNTSRILFTPSYIKKS